IFRRWVILLLKQWILQGSPRMGIISIIAVLILESPDNPPITAPTPPNKAPPIIAPPIIENSFNITSDCIMSL
ncbi:hypothetical protein KIH86_18945, partial [Paenibacillus sp. HN-1]|nr:hypothetical protein [Paenibacillus sinensis]